MQKKYKEFADKISLWGATNNRSMPWKGEKNPYLIWLSEIILQQTRVDQGLKYYIAFKTNFPSIFDLANAPQSKVLKLWEGLGYYSRATNLHETAKHISQNLNGKFPDTYESLLKLKGVGPYTAAAIASFAFNHSKAVVDGNVVRVLSRYFGIKTLYSNAKEKEQIQNIADQIIQSQNPAIYNQAIMDFGATRCTPKKVDCTKCFLNKNCYTFKHNKQLSLPLQKKKVKTKERFFNFFVIKNNQDIYIEQRMEQDIWKSLYQFPLVESQKRVVQDINEIRLLFQEKFHQEDFEIKNVSKPIRQKLSHQILHANFVEIIIKKSLKGKFLKTSIKNLSKFAFPKIINVYLNSKLEYENGK